MTTLIAVYNEDGCIGRCTQYCYDDVDAACDCICHGINHGAGFDKAVHNTAKHCAWWVHKNNFPPHVKPPTSYQLHPAVHATHVTLDDPDDNFRIDLRSPE